MLIESEFDKIYVTYFIAYFLYYINKLIKSFFTFFKCRQLPVVQLSSRTHLCKMEDIKVRFGRRLRELRLEKGLSQEKLANLSEIDRTYIPGIENGKRNVSIKILERLSKVLSISLSDMLKDL